MAGDADALEELLRSLKDPLFRLALRIPGNVADAEDATREVLMKITTALGSFELRSIRTWAFRIAASHATDMALARPARPVRGIFRGSGIEARCQILPCQALAAAYRGGRSRA